MRLTLEEVHRMQELMSSYEKVICYTDGSSYGNPGAGGAGIVFAGVGRKEEQAGDGSIQEFRFSNQESLSALGGKYASEEQFLFGLTLHLGHCSNNYAEYAALILGQLYFALLGQTTPCLKTDSQLVVQQVKGT